MFIRLTGQHNHNDTQQYKHTLHIRKENKEDTVNKEGTHVIKKTY